MRMRTYVALAALFVSLSACSGAPLAPQVAEAIDIADCQLANVKALVPHVETAEAVVAAARAGDTRSAIALLLQLGMQPEEISKVADAFAACMPTAPDPVANTDI